MAEKGKKPLINVPFCIFLRFLKKVKIPRPPSITDYVWGPSQEDLLESVNKWNGGVVPGIES
jgi:hypothetical protein